MTTLQQTLLGRHRAHGRAMEAFGVLLELAERIRLELTAMAELHADPVAPCRHSASEAGDVLRRSPTRWSRAIAPEQAARALEALQRQPNATCPTSADPQGLAAHIHALSGQLAAAVRNADWAGSRGELRASAAETALPQALRSSSAWRHPARQHSRPARSPSGMPCAPRCA